MVGSRIIRSQKKVKIMIRQEEVVKKEERRKLRKVWLSLYE